MTNTDAAVPANVSEAALKMVEDGVTPFQPDVAAMLKAIEDLQKRVADLSAGNSTGDPVKDGVTNLRDHVKVRSQMSPRNDYTVLVDAVSALSEVPTVSECDVVLLAVEDVLERYPNSELSYLKVLARDLKTAVLKAG